MKFIQQEDHVLQPDTMMPPEVQLITDPEMWIVNIYQNKTVSFLCCPEQNEDEVQNAYILPGKYRELVMVTVCDDSLHSTILPSLP